MEMQEAIAVLTTMQHSGHYSSEISDMFGTLRDTLHTLQMISTMSGSESVNAHRLEVLKYFNSIDEETEKVRVDAVKSVWGIFEEDYYPTMTRPNKRMFTKMREHINFELEVEE